MDASRLPQNAALARNHRRSLGWELRRSAESFGDRPWKPRRSAGRKFVLEISGGFGIIADISTERTEVLWESNHV